MKRIIIISMFFLIFTSFIDSKDLKKNQQETIKPEPKPKNEKIEKIEIPQDISAYKSAIDTYKSAIETYRNQAGFYERLLWLIFALLSLFGIIVWRSYAGLKKRTTESISNIQKDTKKKIEENIRQITTTGNITIGTFLFNMGRKQDAIPYLESSLINKEDLATGWPLIIHLSLGAIYCEFNNIAKAIEHSDEAFKLNPNLAIVKILKLRILQLKKDYTSALKEIELAENLAINEKYFPEYLSKIYIFHGTLLAQNKDYKKAKEIFERENVTIENLMLSVPFESPQWSAYDRIKKEAENGIRYLEIRELLKDKFKSEPKEEEINTIVTGMRLAPFANKIELLNQIFEDKEFIAKLKKMFSENLSRSPQTWEILNFGDKWLAITQAKKSIDEIIKEELERCAEFKIRKESEKKYNKLLKQ